MSTTSTPTTAELIQDCQTQLNNFNTALTILNASLTRLAITNVAASPTVAATLASINGTSVNS